MNKIYEEIKEAAQAGEFEVTVSIRRYDAGVVYEVKSKLTDLGYTVLEDNVNHILQISWRVV